LLFQKITFFRDEKLVIQDLLFSKLITFKETLLRLGFVWKIDAKSVELSRMTFAYCSPSYLFNGLLYQAVLLPPPPYHDGDVEAEEERQRHT
jgi:hypothetical protein